MSDGLFGALRRGSIGVVSSLHNHDAWAIRLVFLAGLITILHKAGVPVPHYGATFAVALGVAALLYEMNAAKSALQAFWSGRPGGMLGWSIIWAAAFAYSAMQWTSAASQNEADKTNIHKVAHYTSVNTAKELERTRAEVERLEARLRMQPSRNTDQAQAAIDLAMAHKFWKATDNCRSTKGPQTRAFCSDYASAVADKAGATEALTIKEELKAARSELEKAKVSDASAPKQFAESRSDLGLLKRVSNMSDADAELFSGAFAILVISVFLSGATMLREMEHLRADRKRVPLFTLHGIKRALIRMFTGNDIGDRSVNTGDLRVTHRHLSDLVQMPS